MNTSSVTFRNEPKYSVHAADSKYNARRKELVLLLSDFIINHEIFLSEHVSVTFIHTGVSSLVSILDTGKAKYILKIPLNNVDSELEGAFLKAWENVGVKVPHVFEEGTLGGHYYTLMEFVDAKTVSETYSKEEMTEKGIYKELGSLLRKMHQATTKGYSNIVNKKHEPEYRHVGAWLAGDKIMREQITYVKENSLFDDATCGSIDEALEIIVSTVGNNDETIYCHNDFHSNNVFATEPLTVFDPWPSFQHPYMDLARAIWPLSERVTEQYIAGYFGDELCNRQLLQAFLIVTAYVRSKYQHERGNEAGIKRGVEYLTQTKHYLAAK